ncbi:hypothetical protein [Streptomyces canus]|uniref:hypothetical protein n=1 Tax=Streptomyces canus TaxID=58343 RepID=UPI00371EC65A
MEVIPVAEAAQRLSISDVAVYSAMKAGRLERVPGSDPARVTLASVQRMTADRRAEAMQRRSDLCTLARQADSLLHAPPGSTYLPPAGSREALRALSADTFAIFGRDVLEAAASRDQIRKASGCPTCFADLSARVHQTRPPRDEAAYKILLGQPCPADRQRWRAEAEANRNAMARLRTAENLRRAEAERTAAQAEFQAARRGAEAAASRVRSAAQRVAAVDPAVARQAAVQARRRGGFTASGDLKCGCSSAVYCQGHAALFGTYDRSQANR